MPCTGVINGTSVSTSSRSDQRELHGEHSIGGEQTLIAKNATIFVSVRVWGVINWLVCNKCGQAFQCSNLYTCPYHPDTTKLTTELAAGKVRSTMRYSCCGQPETSFSPMALKQVSTIMFSASSFLHVTEWMLLQAAYSNQ